MVSDLEKESKKSKVAKLWNQLRSLPMDIKKSFINNVWMKKYNLDFKVNNAFAYCFIRHIVPAIELWKYNATILS